MRPHNGNYPQWMGRLSYLVSTITAGELAVRRARSSATMELARFSCNIPIPATDGTI